MQDTHALGLALAEFVFGLLAASGPSDRTTVVRTPNPRITSRSYSITARASSLSLSLSQSSHWFACLWVRAVGGWVQRALERVFEGLFELDVEAIRSFYAAEEQFEAVVAFLDRTDRGGWTVLHALLSRSIPVDVILQTATPFLAGLVDSPSR